jgi:hypothetical protein
VEAAGVELITMLTARKLLIPGSATRAKKAPLPDPLYVYCTKMLFTLESNRQHMATTVSHSSSGIIEKAASSLRYRRSPPFHFLGSPVSITYGLPVTRPQSPGHEWTSGVSGHSRGV